MLQLENHTPFDCTMGVLADAEGVECVCGVVKASFLVEGGRTRVSDEQVAALAADLPRLMIFR